MLVANFSTSDRALASRLAAATGAADADADAESYALMAKILKDDRALTPDADLAALLTVLEREENANGYAGRGNHQPQRSQGDLVKVRVQRNSSGGAGFAFDRENLKITSRPRDASKLSEMQVGDCIVAVNGREVTNAAAYNSLARGVANFELTLRRTGGRASSAPQRPARDASRSQAAGQSSGRRRRPAPQTRQDEWQAMAMDIDSMSYEELLAWEEQQGAVVQPGITDAALDRLPIEHICGGGDECGICLEDFCDGEKVLRLPCLHKFHFDCGRNWLKRQPRCPFCNCNVEI